MEAMGIQQVIGMGKRGIPGHMEKRSLIQGCPKYERISRI